MKLVNGYDFRGKPIIIEFGKKRQQTSLATEPQTESQRNIVNAKNDNCHESDVDFHDNSDVGWFGGLS